MYLNIKKQNIILKDISNGKIMQQNFGNALEEHQYVFLLSNVRVVPTFFWIICQCEAVLKKCSKFIFSIF